MPLLWWPSITSPTSFLTTFPLLSGISGLQNINSSSLYLGRGLTLTGPFDWNALPHGYAWRPSSPYPEGQGWLKLWIVPQLLPLSLSAAPPPSSPALLTHLSHVASIICSRTCLLSLCLIIFVSWVLCRGPSQQTRLIIFLNEQMNEWRNHATQMASVLFMIKITPRSCNSLMSFSFLSSNKFLSSASCRSSLNDLKCRIQNWLPRNATSFPFWNNVTFPMTQTKEQTLDNVSLRKGFFRDKEVNLSGL